jgi:hypothetical protein
VYADFHDLDDENRIRLDCTGTREDLERLGLELSDGLELALYTDDADEHGNPDDLMADGIVHFDEGNQCWVAYVNWNALYHASDLTPDHGATRPPSENVVAKKSAI